MLNSNKTRRALAAFAKYAVLVIIFFFLLFPIYWVLITSFKTNMEAYKFPPSFFPLHPTFHSYVNLFTKENAFFVYYKNNFIVSGFTALFTLILAVMAGYALSRFHFKWNAVVMFLLLASQMFPQVSRMISLYDLLGKVHLINTLTGLILALIAQMLPFTAMLMASFFDGVPRAIEEAARIDGAGRVQILTRLIIPLVQPGVVAVVIYAFLMTWDDYLHALTLIQNDALRTLSAGVALRYLGELSYDWSLINTISVIGILPIIVLFFFFQKHMIAGLVAGAVKG
jgi:multiple sugar transport system permease protein